MFLREQQKFYYLPVIMRDTGGRSNHRSGTSTLTIEIGDKNNNQHTDGYKEIFVYNYKGIYKLMHGPLDNCNNREQHAICFYASHMNN